MPLLAAAGQKFDRKVSRITMTTFVAEAVVVSPSKTIVTHFKDATSTARVSSLKFDASNNAAPDENTFRAVEELLTARNSSDLDVSHHVLSRIEGSSRGVAWKYFLKVPTGTNEYLLACQVFMFSPQLRTHFFADQHCQKQTQAEQKPYDKKIRDDSFRTFKGDHEFWSRVKEDALVRVLNALSLEFGYVQGMNVLLGPFIYTLSEQESFHYMSTLLRNHIPRYVLKNLDGAHDGSKLFAKCLHLVDPKLYTHILSKIPDLSIFSLKYVLTLFANCKPLSEVIKLWDAVFAVGPHFNILLLCAKVMLVRDTILKEKRGAK